MDNEQPAHCELCHRSVDALTRHHLIPRTRHRNKKVQRLFSREQMQNRVVWVCAPCHRHIHATFSEKELALTYNNVNALKAHPGIRRFIDWIEDKPPAFKPKSRSWKR